MTLKTSKLNKYSEQVIEKKIIDRHNPNTLKIQNYSVKKVNSKVEI